MNTNVLGYWALIIGILLAIIGGLTTISAMPIILFILGLIIGFLNIKEREGTPFLVGVIALLLIGVAGLRVGGQVVVLIMNNFITLMAAAGLVVALKQVLVAAKPTS